MIRELGPRIAGGLFRLALFAGAVAALTLLVRSAAEGSEDWVELGIITAAVVAACMGFRQRGRASPRRSYRIHRSPESRW